eukprot:403363046
MKLNKFLAKNIPYDTEYDIPQIPAIQEQVVQIQGDQEEEKMEKFCNAEDQHSQGSYQRDQDGSSGQHTALIQIPSPQKSVSNLQLESQYQSQFTQINRPLNFGQSQNQTQQYSQYQNRAQNYFQNRQERNSTIIDSKYMPIKALNTFSRDWQIQAKLARKSELRETQRQKTVVLKIEIIDVFGTTIECTFFADAAKDFNQRLEVNKVYLFSNGQVKPNDKRFSTLPNDFCIVFEQTANIIECNEDIQIEDQKGEFDNTLIGSIEECDVNKPIDVSGVIIEMADQEIVKLKNGQHKLVCEIDDQAEDSNSYLNSQKMNQEEIFYFNGYILKTYPEKIIYKACISNDCKRKVEQTQDGVYYCEKCKKCFDNYAPTYMFSVYDIKIV